MRKNRPQSALPATERQPARWTRFAPLLIVAAGAIVYVNSFEGVFLFDDALHIEENPRIQQLWPVADVLSGRRPAVDFSLAVNYAIGGLDVGGYHAFNLVVHLLAALTLFGVVHRSLRGRRCQDHLGRAAPELALTIALIWVVHPLQTQSVTYIIQRGESMMGLYYLLTLYCIIRGSDSSRRVVWCGVAVLAGVMGLASKAIMITAPLTVLIYDRAFLTKSFREAFRLRWGLYLALVASWGVLALCGVAQGVLDPVERPGTGVGFGYKGVTPGEYLLTQSGVIMHYLRLSIWPHPLCLDYAWPVARSVREIVLPGLVIIGLLIGTLWALRRRPWLGFAGTWFFLILGPTSSIVPIRDPAFEHRMYLPLAAVVTVLVAAAFSLLGWIFRRSLPGARTPRLITMVLAMAIVIALDHPSQPRLSQRLRDME